MEAEARRAELLAIMEQQQKPISATRLAERLGVSRQIIVGDVALLRATGCEIVATARGYLLSSKMLPPRFQGKIACQHSLEDTRNELYAIVDLGGEVLDVSVEHHLYGEMTGRLDLSSRRDVDAFMERLAENKARLLSELTGGVHLHTIACKDEETLSAIKERLEALGFLYPET